MKDLKDLYPKIKLKGFETSNYAIDNTLNEVKNISKSSDYTKINSEDKKYDFVMALELFTLHH